MTTILIVLALGAIGVVTVIWATRRRPGTTSSNAPRESDTAWNDPVTPAGQAANDETPRP